jgi:hypothetical protein
MPDPKENAKLTGDTHPPEVEDLAGERRPQGRPETEGAHGEPKDDSLSRDLENEGRAGKGINQAGYLKDKDGGVGKEK